MLTKQEVFTVTGAGGAYLANFWAEWGKPALEDAILVLSFAALVLLVWNRILDIQKKRKDLRQESNC